MQHELTPELVTRANLLARSYNDAFYCTLHSALGDYPTHQHYAGGWAASRAIRVWAQLATDQPPVYLLSCQHDGTNEQLLEALSDELFRWHLSGDSPADAATVSEPDAEALLALARHPLTTAATRAELLADQVRLMNGRQARVVTATLTAKIEAQSPGVLTGRGWMPHGPAEPRPSPHPFPLAT